MLSKLRQFNVLGRKRCSPFSSMKYFFPDFLLFACDCSGYFCKIFLQAQLRIKYSVISLKCILLWRFLFFPKHTAETVKTIYNQIIVFTTSGLSRDVADAVARCSAYVSLHEKEHALYRLAGGEFSWWKKRNSECGVQIPLT